MWERYELKDEETNEVKLVYELKRDIANDMVSKDINADSLINPKTNGKKFLVLIKKRKLNIG